MITGLEGVGVTVATVRPWWRRGARGRERPQDRQLASFDEKPRKRAGSKDLLLLGVHPGYPCRRWPGRSRSGSPSC